jgi:hypothetical protein
VGRTGIIPPVVGDDELVLAGDDELVPVAGDDEPALAGSTVTCGGESSGAGVPVLAVCSEVANVEVVVDPGAVASL